MNASLTLGCIGCGNMGGAILKGLVAHPALRLLGFDHTRAKVEALNPEGQTRVEWAESPEVLAEAADIILLAVKPHQIADMIHAIRPRLTSAKLIVSVAAAVSLDSLAEASEKICSAARVMPNLPVLVGKGVFALCLDDPSLSEAQKTVLLDLFRLLGLTVVLPEDKFPAFSSVVGCGPAFVCLFMEGLQNAAVTLGFKAGEAKALVAAMVEGTALLAQDDDGGFADLRSRVCSPGGTTIRGVNHLERQAVRGHVADAVFEAYRRDLALAGKPADV